MRKFALLLTCVLLCGLHVVFAQSRSITGTVTDSDDGSTLPGVSVVVKGTSIGTVTDIDGKFSLNVTKDAKTLRFTFVGFEPKEVELGATSNYAVKLAKTDVSVDEVVVTSMGISKAKKALGYAVQDVQSEELTQGSSNNLATALQGKVSGVEVKASSGMPGASSQIVIRGARSFTGDNTPLYVVDGMPINSTSDVSTENSVTGSDYATRSMDIDPNDIESINILKGQAASALYGMRASNGVVIITTKSGKGQVKGKPLVTLNTSVSFDDLSVTPNLQTKYAQGAKGKFNPTASTSWGPVIAELANDATYGGNTDNKYTQKFGLHSGQYYVPQRAAAGLDPWATPQAYNNVADFFQLGYTNSNSVNVSQNLGGASYSFSLGNSNSEGIVPSTGLDRYNVKLTTEIKLSDHFTTGGTGNFVTTKISKQTGANNGLMAVVFPAPPSYDLAGIPSHVDGDPYTQNNYRGTAGFDAAYWAIENNKFLENTQRFFGSTFLKYSTKLAEGQNLDVKYQIGTDSYATDYSDIWGYGHSNGLGQAEEYAYIVREINSLLTASYNWTISSDLVFDAMVGNEIVDKNKKYNYASGLNYNFSGWNSINNATVYSAYTSEEKSRTVGTFGNLSLAYKNMLFLNATGRYDIVSSMPRNNRSFFYPSVSLGLIFTEFDAMKNDVLTYGKIRLSYAEVGQADVYYDSYYKTPVYGGGFSSGTPIQYPIGSVVAFTPYGKVYDPNLKPQNTKSYELGADFALFNGLFELNYTFSRQNVVDQIFEVPLAGSTGSGTKVTNGGSIHTNSHEITLGVNPINKKNFKWDFAFNFSKIDNYVDELAEGVESIFLGGFVEPQVRAGIGDKFPVIYGVSYLRNDDGKIIVDADGLPQPGEEKVIGTVSPDFQLGFNTSINIYKLKLAATFDWSNGGQMYYATAGMLDYYGASQRSADMREQETFKQENAVIDNGDGTYSENNILLGPGGNGISAQTFMSYENDISESMIYDKSYIKLRELALGYNLINKNNISLDINLFARNILLWSAIDSFDPEVSQGNTNMSGAFERFSLPNTKSFGLGINFKF